MQRLRKTQDPAIVRPDNLQSGRP